MSSSRFRQFDFECTFRSLGSHTLRLHLQTSSSTLTSPKFLSALLHVPRLLLWLREFCHFAMLVLENSAFGLPLLEKLVACRCSGYDGHHVTFCGLRLNFDLSAGIFHINSGNEWRFTSSETEFDQYLVLQFSRSACSNPQLVAIFTVSSLFLVITTGLTNLSYPISVKFSTWPPLLTFFSSMSTRFPYVCLFVCFWRFTAGWWAFIPFRWS